MDFQRSICRMLHDEHRKTIEAMDGLEDLLARGRRGVPDLDDVSTRKLLAKLAGMIDDEVRSHFNFEEGELFTRLAEQGDEAIGAHLTEEHNAILPVGERVAELAREAIANGMSESDWEDFRTLSAEFIERMLAHIQKEEMALLPLLEGTLGASEDAALVTTYGERKT